MKTLKFILICFLLVSFQGFGQIKFFKIFTNNGYDRGEGIAQLSDSSYLVTGASSSFSDEPSQVFILKLDSLGNYKWSKNYGGSENDWGQRVLNWNDSIFFVTGFSNSALSDSYNAYLLKVDKDGNELMFKHFLHPGWDRINDALITQDSLIYMVGQTTGTSNSNSNFYIIKSNVYGDTLWTKNFGSSGEDALYSIKQFDDTTFFAVGEMYNEDSLKVKAAILKFDHNGTVLWSRNYGADGAYSLRDCYFVAPYFFSVGTRMNPEFLDQDEFRMTVMLNTGDLFFEESIYSEGNVGYDQVCEYGSNNQIYIASNYQTQFSAGGSVDAGITRFFNNLIWNSANTSVSFQSEDRVEHLIATNDGGAIATGFMSAPGMGGTSMYVLKIGANDVFPSIDYGDISNNSIESLVSVNEMAAETSLISIYPNPSNGLIYFKTSKPVAVQIIDVNGRKVFENVLFDGASIQSESWEKGIYFVDIQTENSTRKIVKLIVQ